MSVQDIKTYPAVLYSSKSTLLWACCKPRIANRLFGDKIRLKNLNLRIFRVTTLKNPIPDAGVRVQKIKARPLKKASATNNGSKSLAQFLNSQCPEILGTSMAEITKEEMRERLGNIDQIRDIIFGAQLREYDNRFDKIDSDLSMMQQDMQSRIEQVKTVLSAEMKVAVDSLEKKVKSLTSNTQEESADLRQQVDRVNRKFSSSMEALDEAIDNQTSSLRDELSKTRDRLSEETRTLKTQVFEELDRRFSMLRDVKVSRDDMAEILFELGMRLKGTEFVPELKGAADNKLNTEFLLPERHHNG